MWQYIPTLATTLLAAAVLAKDWQAHKTHWRRGLVLFLIMLSGLGGMANTYYSNKNNSQRRLEDQNQIAGLTKAMDTEKKALESNTKAFLQSFKDLSDKLNNLESQVKTAHLQEEANRLRKELEATQKALNPPKATLVPSLGDVTEKLENLDVKQIPVKQSGDGTISFTITVVNISTVDAMDGSIFLRICEGCAYAEEPARFRKAVASEPTDREMVFHSIRARTSIGIPLKSIPAPGKHNRIETALTLRCSNCEFTPRQNLYVKY